MLFILLIMFVRKRKVIYMYCNYKIKQETNMFQSNPSTCATAGVEGYNCTGSHSVTHHRALDEGRGTRDRAHRPLADKHTTLTGEISMPSAGFEPAIPASERQQFLALGRPATGIGEVNIKFVAL